MTKNYYDIQTVMGLHDDLRQLVRQIVTDGFALHEAKALKDRPTKTYQLRTTEGRVEDITIIFSGNPLRPLGLDPEDDPNPQLKEVTMAIFIHGTPWGISLTREDIDLGLEKTLASNTMIQVSNSLLEHIVAAMAREWYRYGLSDRIGTYVEAQDFEAITKQFNGMIDASWDDLGFNVSLRLPASDSEELQIAKQETHYNALNQGQSEGQSHKDRCLRIVHLYAITLITLGLAEEGFTWPLVEM